LVSPGDRNKTVGKKPAVASGDKKRPARSS
jgi:hypothetical protein